jgi:DNA-directed RNA polymerase subunit RPC12/RpoP
MSTSEESDAETEWHCLRCHTEFTAFAHLGVYDLECPDCGTTADGESVPFEEVTEHA